MYYVYGWLPGIFFTVQKMENKEWSNTGKGRYGR